MATRRSFITSSATRLRPHDHVAWCGEGPEEFRRVAVAALSSAALRGERMLLVSEHGPGQLAGLDGLDGLESFIEQGTLMSGTVEDVYCDLADPAAQRAVFEQAVEEALAGGYTGICVVADNSPLAGGSEEEFRAWLTWEATADRAQAEKPVTGICYFDRGAVTAQRLSDISSMHPVLSASVEEPKFRIYVDGDAVRVTGELDFWCAQQLRRVLLSSPKGIELVLDFSKLSFIDHRALLVLEQVASAGHDVRIRRARPIVHRMWEHLGMDKAQLEAC